jgi:hypothetical protein
MITSFTRIVVVLAFLRSALGLQQTPPNAVLISLALFVTAFIMAPTLEQADREGLAPLLNEDIVHCIGVSLFLPFCCGRGALRGLPARRARKEPPDRGVR